MNATELYRLSGPGLYAPIFRNINESYPLEQRLFYPIALSRTRMACVHEVKTLCTH